MIEAIAVIPADGKCIRLFTQNGKERTYITKIHGEIDAISLLDSETWSISIQKDNRHVATIWAKKIEQGEI